MLEFFQHYGALLLLFISCGSGFITTGMYGNDSLSDYYHSQHGVPYLPSRIPYDVAHGSREAYRMYLVWSFIAGCFLCGWLVLLAAVVRTFLH